MTGVQTCALPISLKSEELGSVPLTARNIREIFTIGSTQPDDANTLHTASPAGVSSEDAAFCRRPSSPVQTGAADEVDKNVED